jgi:hypothetical protein
MMQDVHRIAMPKAVFKIRRFFSPANWVEIKEETSEVLHLDNSIVKC